MANQALSLKNKAIYSLASQNVLRLLGLLAELEDHVVWIRTPDYRKQLYLSPSFEKIWGRSPESIDESPLAWSETLVDDAKARKILELCARNPMSDIHTRNTSYYRIMHQASGEIRFIEDTCFYLTNHEGLIIAVAGVAKAITETVFDQEVEALIQERNKTHEEKKIAEILEKQDADYARHEEDYQDGLSRHYIFMRDGNYIKLTDREYETLGELLRGKSTKEIAKLLSVSPRTVDVYVENIKNKLSFQKKTELFQKIHPLYIELFLQNPIKETVC